ncbi:hypothetical protein AVEN_252856-1 [Araneus ventricosus]|uniref:Uncharacterized protein n=1 Tax=Araneus ventricosus TaxID=182803 RepID=A0A4Y2NCT7_ARAVE|nr:hypothetical protein AVEN_252856-1 [Araneus ventricosus]
MRDTFLYSNGRVDKRENPALQAKKEVLEKPVSSGTFRSDHTLSVRDNACKVLRRPGVRPGSTAWKAAMLCVIPPTRRDGGLGVSRMFELQSFHPFTRSFIINISDFRLLKEMCRIIVVACDWHGSFQLIDPGSTFGCDAAVFACVIVTRDRNIVLIECYPSLRSISISGFSLCRIRHNG